MKNIREWLTIKGHIKEMLHIRQTDDTLTRVIGSGLSTAVPLIIGLMAGNMRIGTFGALGAFAFLSFQPFTPTKLAKRILKAGLAIMAGFLAGSLSTLVPWMIPITISLVSLIGFLVVRILHIPNPGAFFVIMVTSMGAGVKLDIPGMLQAVSFVGIGVAASIFWAVLAVIFNNRVLNRPYRNDIRSYREHLYDAVENDSELLLSSVHHAGILFLATYLAHSLGIGNFYWVAVSCAAVLQGRELKVIFHRHVQRIVGGMVGLGIGIFLFSLQFSTVETVVVLIVLNFFVEYAMVRNYGLANFFTNPLALLLSNLSSSAFEMDLIGFRFYGLVRGSIVGFAGAALISFAMGMYEKELKLAHKYHKHQETPSRTD